MKLNLFKHRKKTAVMKIKYWTDLISEERFKLMVLLNIEAKGKLTVDYWAKRKCLFFIC